MTKPSEFIQADESHFTILRAGSKEAFSYVYLDGTPIQSAGILREIEELVIPPNWQNVHVSPNPLTHIRAFGYDDKHRKQYIYHDGWRKFKDQLKFDNLILFAENLPSIRRKAHKDIQRKKWDRQKTLGLIILTLDNTHIRIGNQRYQERNSTYGATTLRRKHLDIDDGEVIFSYKGKSDKYRRVRMDNTMLSKLIVKCAELPGHEIFTYHSRGEYHSVQSSQVNDYLKTITGEDFSAKDFRTWAGSSLAIEYLPEALNIIKKNKRKKMSTTVVKLVAKELGNTVSVCRSHYIHPKIMNALENNEHEHLLFRNHRGGKYALSAAEKKTLSVIAG